jgi:Zn-dependent protease
MDLDPLFIRSGLIIFFLLVASIVLHEWGHAIVAHLLGDDTPSANGRVTLNPMAHLDWMGTVIVPVINIFILGGGGFAFIGWGKPVMTNPSNFKHRVRDDLLVSLAGPAVNLLVALAAIVVGSLVVVSQPRFAELVKGLVFMNVGLAIFNLLPIPPLDGGSILRRIIGISDEAYLTIGRWSSLVLLLAINIDVTRNAIMFLVEESCLPYFYVCRWISPGACRIIFRL